jgi:hypothetical protein
VTTPLVTVELCRVRGTDVAGLLAAGRRAVRARRADRDVLLAKLLATTGSRFVPRDVRPTRWALLTCRADGEPATSWSPSTAVESATLQLRPLAGRGGWDGVELFATSYGDEVTDDGPVAVLTRATLRLRHVRRFYAQIPAIASEIGAAGPRLAFGFGEAPLLRQGTFSVWDSAASLSAFHRTARAHATAMRRTPEIGWYAEELFARLRIVDAHGSIDGIAVDDFIGEGAGS